jgi:carboxypeptidase Taq
MKKAFPGVFDDVSLEAFLFAVNRSEPSYIRTEADEVTYNLHICLRYEMETELIKGGLKVADVPACWNELTKKFLGLAPPNDAQGCLQDVHWSHGSFGYFPTYTLGNLYAAQFYEAVEYEMGRLEPLFEKGNFTVLKKWLNEKIHSQGQRYKAGELCRKITGHKLSSKPFLDYLEKKFGALYGF